MSETINIEKYVEALNNILGADSAYFKGDSDVDALVELINMVAQLELKATELAKYAEKLEADKKELIKAIGNNTQQASEVTIEEISTTKIETV